MHTLLFTIPGHSIPSPEQWRIVQAEVTMAHLCGGSRLERESSTKVGHGHAPSPDLKTERISQETEKGQKAPSRA